MRRIWLGFAWILFGILLGLVGFGILDSDYQSATRLFGLGQSALWDHRSGAGASGQQEQRLTEETWSMQIFPRH